MRAVCSVNAPPYRVEGGRRIIVCRRVANASRRELADSGRTERQAGEEPRADRTASRGSARHEGCAGPPKCPAAAAAETCCEARRHATRDGATCQSSAEAHRRDQGRPSAANLPSVGMTVAFGTRRAEVSLSIATGRCRRGDGGGRVARGPAQDPRQIHVACAGARRGPRATKRRTGPQRPPLRRGGAAVDRQQRREMSRQASSSVKCR